RHHGGAREQDVDADDGVVGVAEDALRQGVYVNLPLPSYRHWLSLSLETSPPGPEPWSAGRDEPHERFTVDPASESRERLKARGWCHPGGGRRSHRRPVRLRASCSSP